MIDRGSCFFQKWLLLHIDSGRLIEIMSPIVLAFTHRQRTNQQYFFSTTACSVKRRSIHMKCLGYGL